MGPLRDYILHGPRYTVILEWSEADQSFLATVPALPGCVADGEDYELALMAAREAIYKWVVTASNRGRALPRPDQPLCGVPTCYLCNGPKTRRPKRPKKPRKTP